MQLHAHFFIVITLIRVCNKNEVIGHQFLEDTGVNETNIIAVMKTNNSGEHHKGQSMFLIENNERHVKCLVGMDKHIPVIF